MTYLGPLVREELPEPIHGSWGQEVFRVPEGILKIADHHEGDERFMARCQGMLREAWMLERLEDSGITPRVKDFGDGWILLEDLGPSVPPPDGELLRRTATRLLYQIRQQNVIHGDLTEPNIIWRPEGRAWAIDWQDASVMGDEPPLQKSAFSDSYLMWRTISWMSTEGSPTPDTPRVARRWMAVLSDLGAVQHHTMPLRGKSFIDLGCFQGDFVAMAATEGMAAVGLDQGGFRSGEDSIAIGRDLWQGMTELTLDKGDILKVGLDHAAGMDVAMCFSTWAYFLEDAGWGTPGPLTKLEGAVWLGLLAASVGRLYFETQYSGDGPGPLWLQSDDDVVAMLESVGCYAEAVAQFPVTGRPATRTVWRVTT